VPESCFIAVLLLFHCCLASEAGNVSARKQQPGSNKNLFGQVQKDGSMDKPRGQNGLVRELEIILFRGEKMPA
jgi:hypothetical protein